MKKCQMYFAAIILLGMGLLSACGPGLVVGAPTPAATRTLVPEPTLLDTPESGLATYFVPPYYSQFYIDTVNGSKQENNLVIYSIMSADNWAPIIQAFNEHYPWIKVTTFDLGAAEVFSRYNQDIESGGDTADIIVSSDPISWQQFIESGEVLTYRSPEDLFVPDWSKASIGLYTVSSDPMLIIYNKRYVTTPIDRLQQVSDMVAANPLALSGRIVTYDAEKNATGFAINWFWTDFARDAGWKRLETLGLASPVLMTSGGNMVEGVGRGDYSIGYFVSAITVYPRLKDYPDLAWSYIKDGEPILLRNMAITQKSKNPNSAKLMVDFILSQEGQLALGMGGLTPYRSDVAEIAPTHLDNIIQEVGSSNIFFFTLDQRLLDPSVRQTFLDRWKQTVGVGVIVPTPQVSPTP